MIDQSSNLPTRSNRSEPGAQNRISGASQKRRTFLRAAGLATASLATLTSTGTVTASDDYGTVVNIVEDYGADPTGEESINEELGESVQDDTKVVFPDGTYWVDGKFSSRVLSHTALVGEDNPTLVPTEGSAEEMFRLGNSELRFEGFTVDYSPEDTATSVFIECDDGLVMKDVSFRGVRDVTRAESEGQDGRRHCYTPHITDPDGSGIVENVHCPDGSADGVQQGGTTAHTFGELTFRNCSWEGFADNGLYASGATAPVKVEKCYGRNNNVASIRLGSAGSYVENCTIEIHDVPRLPYSRDEVPSVGYNARAIRIQGGFRGHIKNCDIYTTSKYANGIRHRSGDEDSGTALEISNTRIRIDSEEPSPSDPDLVDDDEPNYLWGLYVDVDGEPIELKNVEITGNAPQNPVVKLENRDATVSNSCIYQTGDSRDGIEFVNSNSSVRNTTINVPGEAIIADQDSDVTQENVSSTGTC